MFHLGCNHILVVELIDGDECMGCISSYFQRRILGREDRAPTFFNLNIPHKCWFTHTVK